MYHRLLGAGVHWEMLDTAQTRARYRLELGHTVYFYMYIHIYVYKIRPSCKHRAPLLLRAALPGLEFPT